MIKFILKTSCVIRPYISRLLWFIIKPFLKRPEPGIWNKVKKLPINVFNSVMAPTNYNSDPAMGILDYTIGDMDYYFYTGNDNNILYGRDCDDNSEVWYNYLCNQPDVEEIYMILAIDGYKISSSHFFIVAKFTDQKFYLFNRCRYNEQFTDLSDACEEFRRYPLTVHGKYKNLQWVIYKKCHVCESY